MDILQNVFYHEKFKEMQRQVINQLTSNKDTLTIMPTGGGKSICYWVPGLASMGVTVVITPLVALLNDQVAKLKNYGINVCYVNSSICYHKSETVCSMNWRKKFHSTSSSSSHQNLPLHHRLKHVLKQWYQIKRYPGSLLMKPIALTHGDKAFDHRIAAYFN